MQVIKKFLQSKDIDKGYRRIRRASLSGIVTLVNRFVTMGSGLISIPLTAHYLGTERFGIWLTLSTFLAWVTVADLGLANSLTNALASADGKEDQKQAKEMVSSAFFMLVSLIFVVAILLLVVYQLTSWTQVFNLKSPEARSQINLAVLVSILIFVLRLPLSIPMRVYEAYQEGYLYQLWSICGNILAFTGLLFAIHLHANLPLLLGVFFGVAILGDVFAGLYMFGWRRQWLTPSLRDFRRLQAQWLLRTGSQLWLAQISAIVMFQTDLIIVAQLFGASEVASYGVILKLFSTIGTISMAFLSPLWPAYSEALARNDIPWIVKTFKKSVIISIFWSLSTGILLSLFCTDIIRAWVGQDAIPSLGLIIAMFCTSVITTIAHSVGVLVGGLCEFKIAAQVGIIQGVVNLLASVVFGHLIGVSGVAWATGICLLIFSIGIMGTKTVGKLNFMHKEYKASHV